jgi:fructose-1,6-bisphosphatase I
MKTLSTFLAGTELAPLIADIAESCKQVAAEINRGALHGKMGSLDATNVQGETQKQLDVIANDIWLQVNEQGGHYAGMASEEMEAPYLVPEHYRQSGKYLLLFDPLDGSSNVDLNFTVGSIFSILVSPNHAPALEDFLQPGSSQVAAGYALYGSSTMLVLTTGQGVNGFTLDETSGDFVLTHPDMRIPQDTSEFAINMSRQRLWEAPVKRYIAECLQGKDGPRGKDFNMRWVASMVAEVHRILIRGGVFMYPIDDGLRTQGGRLRLMYEANPMAMLVEQAGGFASAGLDRILDIPPEALHQRVPVFLGSRDEIERIILMHRTP